MTCKECGCTTGGGEYCFRHVPYTVRPLKDGSYWIDRNGGRTRVFFEPPGPEPFCCECSCGELPAAPYGCEVHETLNRELMTRIFGANK